MEQEALGTAVTIHCNWSCRLLMVSNRNRVSVGAVLPFSVYYSGDGIHP